MKKQIFKLLAVFILASSMLLACGGGKKPTEPPPATREPVVEITEEAPMATEAADRVFEFSSDGVLEVRIPEVGSLYYIRFLGIRNEDTTPEGDFNGFWIQNGGHYPLEVNGVFFDLGTIELVPPIVEGAGWGARMYMASSPLRLYMGPLPSVEGITIPTEPDVLSPLTGSVVVEQSTYTVNPGDILADVITYESNGEQFAFNPPYLCGTDEDPYGVAIFSSQTGGGGSGENGITINDDTVPGTYTCTITVIFYRGNVEFEASTSVTLVVTQ